MGHPRTEKLRRPADRRKVLAHPTPSCLVRSVNRRFRMSTRLVQQLVTFVKSEDGPTAVEYAVMLALIIVVCIGAISRLGSNANNTFDNVGNAVNVGS